ncbi:MAG: hypothetical protein JXQ72_01520 [Anaerolineae bacterium]|nr:hypothetical protein [Anaerolineae bacterium]
MDSRRNHAQLVLIVVLLLVQMALRVHHPMEQPSFVDENHHITRAQIVYHFNQNPTAFSHGKLLYYYYLGLFTSGGTSALIVSRLAMALFSLFTSAVIVRLAQMLFGPRATIPALAFYALAPYAVFFERMALADPFAAGLAALTAWVSIRLARRPSIMSGTTIGLAASLTSLAKLTTAGIAVIIPLAVLLFGRVTFPQRRRAALRVWLKRLWEIYGAALGLAVLVIDMIWGTVVLVAILCNQNGNKGLIVNGTLIDQPDQNGLLDNLDYTWDAVEHYLSVPAVLAVIGLAVLVLARRPKAGVYVLAWLLALWMPPILVATRFETRYLVTGIPALAVIVGGGAALAADVVGRRTAAVLTVVGLALWATLFALPFAHRSATDFSALDIPAQDQYSYISGPFTGFGARDAVDYLVANAERTNGQVPVVSVLRHCGSISLYIPKLFAWTCMDFNNTPGRIFPPRVAEWAPFLEQVKTWPFVYLITEYTNVVPLDAPPDVPPLGWTLEFTAARPLGGRTVAVWRVAASPVSQSAPGAAP